MVKTNNCLYLAYFYVFLCKSHIHEQFFMLKNEMLVLIAIFVRTNFEIWK